MPRDEALIEALNAIGGRTVHNFKVMYGVRGEITSFVLLLDGGAALVVGFDEGMGVPALKGKAVLPAPERSPYEIKSGN